MVVKTNTSAKLLVMILVQAFVALCIFNVLSYIGVRDANATTSEMSTYSWDPGLYASADAFGNQVSVWGTRQNEGAWGQRPTVNYQAGATLRNRASSSGQLSVKLDGNTGSNCNLALNNCTFGSGTGFKQLVQLWNDPGNYIAFGIIHDPGVSPNGTTLMIEGAGHGRPVGGYWGNGGLPGQQHIFTITWNSAGVSLRIDKDVNLGPYPVEVNAGPSISFLGAAREWHDSANSNFHDINFTDGSVVEKPIIVPAGDPDATVKSTLKDMGSGTGHSAYVGLRTQSSAISAGVQTDNGAIQHAGEPTFMVEMVNKGQTYYAYIGVAQAQKAYTFEIKYWDAANGLPSNAIVYRDGVAIRQFQIDLTDGQPSHLISHSVEANGKNAGDNVNATFTDTTVSRKNSTNISDRWNTNNYNYYGIFANQVVSNPEAYSDAVPEPVNNANFEIKGTVNGASDWDKHLIGGLAMISTHRA
jgi:hypothetical protein